MPLAAFEGDNMPWIVNIKMVAINSNGMRSPLTTAGPVTVGPVTAPVAVTAFAADFGDGGSVTVLYTPGDTTGIADRCENSPAQRSSTAQRRAPLSVLRNVVPGSPGAP